VELYVARHARAAGESRGGERPLTDEGREDARRVGRALEAAGVKLSSVWHSPKLRARETADLLAGAVGAGAELEERVDLQPLSDPTTVLDAVRDAVGPVLVVGHLPHVERLGSLLLTGSADAEVVDIPPGGVLRFVSGEGRDWRLTWFVTPGLLPREAGKA